MSLLKLYKPFVVSVLLVLILIDMFSIIESSVSFFSYIRLTIKAILIVMIFTDNKYVYTGIKLWSILFLLLIPSVQLIAKVIKFFLGDYELVIYKPLLLLVVGIIIYFGLNNLKSSNANVSNRKK